MRSMALSRSQNAYCRRDIIWVGGVVTATDRVRVDGSLFSFATTSLADVARRRMVYLHLPALLASWSHSRILYCKT